jgi:hypothetical protein
MDKFRTPVLGGEHALKLGIFGINLRGGDPSGEVRVVRDPEAADDLSHRWSIMITA